MLLTESHGTFRAGRYFLHAHWLENDLQPQRCKVTKVSGDVIYYRCVYFDDSGTESYGSPAMFSANEIKHYVLPNA